MSFGARLAEERKRLGLRQVEFAGLVGIDPPKQSLYENNRRELRGDYLARLAGAEVDVVYVLTGRRGDVALRDASASDLLSAYFALPDDLREALSDFAGRLREQFEARPKSTLHGGRSDYRTGR